MSKRNYAQIAYDYCIDALNDTLPNRLASKLEKLACQRHLNDLARQDDPDYPYYFSEVAGNRHCRFLEKLHHVKGKWKGQLFKLEPHQVMMHCTLFGWLKKKNNLRRFTKAYYELTRKSGKSFSAAGIGLYMAFCDGENGALACAGATTEAQARMVFSPAYEMCKMDEDLMEAFNLKLAGTSVNPTAIYRPDDMSMFKPVIGKLGDGDSISCGIADEYHEHATSALLDTFSTGTGSRENPLILIITTAGFDLSSPCYSEHLDAIKILEGSLQMDHVHVMIFGIDPEDDWTDFAVWKKANPNYMVSITEDSLIEAYNTAMASLKDRPAILTKRLNVWQNAGNAWMDMQKFKQCGSDDISLEDFKGCQCWLSIDLASKIDLCALMLNFKLPGDSIKICPSCGEKVVFRDERYVCENVINDNGCTWERKGSFKVVSFGKYYLPSETCDKTENAHYRLWKEEGILTITEGARTDFRLIENDIKKLSKEFTIMELVFDQREAGYLVSSIQEWANFECIEFPQGVNLISPPMKELEAIIYDKSFVYDNKDKILFWSMGNVIKKQAKSGGATKTYFPTKSKDSDKIDPVVSIIMGLGRLMVYDFDSGDSYNARAARGEENILRVI